MYPNRSSWTEHDLWFRCGGKWLLSGSQTDAQIRKSAPHDDYLHMHWWRTYGGPVNGVLEMRGTTGSARRSEPGSPVMYRTLHIPERTLLRLSSPYSHLWLRTVHERLQVTSRKPVSAM